MQIFHFNSADEAVAACGEALNNWLVENNRPVLLLLSGGSAFGALDYVGEKALGENLTVSLLDERFSQDPAINNFLRLQKTDFYQRAAARDIAFIGTLPRQGESLADFTTRISLAFKNWQTENSNGVIIATLGMGEDGHTAGIFPTNTELEFANKFGSKNWTAGYEVAGQNICRQRMTSTLSILNMLTAGFALVTGPAKQAKFSQISQPGELYNLPARSWQQINNLEVYTDLV